MRNIVYFIILFTLFVTSINSQTGMENILKAYKSWTTNFEIKSIDLNELLSGGPPKDGIPAIINPKFTTLAAAAEWLDSMEPVISVTINGISKAYPLQILIFHEIVNDRIGRVPLLVSFCPLCYSGIVFNRTVNNMPINFGVSGLLRNSDMIMYDQLTESFWQQFTGEAIVGELTGTKLSVVSSQIISFEQFRTNFPDGLVLSKETGYKRPYGLNPYINYDNLNTKPFLYDGEIDDRLPQNEKVVGIKGKVSSKAYPYSVTSNQRVINDIFENKDIVIFHIAGTRSSLDQRYIEDSKDIGSTGVFNRSIDSLSLTFLYDENKIYDKETNSEWTITGQCIAGPLKSKQLVPISHGDYFSFAWFAFNPKSLLHNP